MSLEHHRDLAREFPELKQESPEFRELFEDYQSLDNEILHIEQEIETPSDDYTGPPDQVWRDYTHETNELVTVIEGRLEVKMHGVRYTLEPGDELFIPRNAVHTVRNVHAGATRWLYGYD